MIERVAALTADAVAPLLLKESAPAKFAALSSPTAGQAEPDVRRNRPRRNRPSRNPAPAKAALPDLAARRSRQPRHHLRPRARRANRTADGSGWPCAV